MKVQRIVTTALLIFVFASVLYLIVDEFRRRGQVHSNSEELLGTGHRVVAYYFHGMERCLTCRTIEKYAHEALTNGFPEELRSRKVIWRLVNFDEPANEHFVKDYQLIRAAVVLVELEDGKVKKSRDLEEVWNLYDDKDKFVAYVQKELRSFLQKHDG